MGNHFERVKNMILDSANPNYKFHVRENMESDFLVVKEIWQENVYEVHDTHCNRGGVVVDIGANIAVFSVWAAAHGAKVIAVEPESNNLSLLRENLKLNNVESLVTVVPLGISNFNGTAIINDGGGGASIKDNVVNGETIDIITLDKLFSNYEITDVDILKIDVEGSEPEIILGASRKNINKCKYITMEFDVRSGSSLGEIVKKLSETHHIRTMGSWERGGMVWAWLY